MRSAIPRDLVSPSGYPSSVGASHPRRRLSSSVGTTYLRRTESGRPNLTLPLVRKIQRRRREGEKERRREGEKERRREGEKEIRR